jgi:two-component system NarL family response regulator
MKILLVDDHALFLEGLSNFLKVNDIEVVGTAKDSTEALYKVTALAPELVLMDVQMAGDDGIAATRLIKEKYPDLTIVMLTASEDQDSLFAAIQAGATGYLLKSMEPDLFLEQLYRINDGDMPLAPGLAKRFLQEFARRTHAPKEDEVDVIMPALTERQTEVLELLTEGLTYKNIALKLDLKEVTVKYHVKEIISKLHLANRAQLLAHASKLGVK